MKVTSLQTKIMNSMLWIVAFWGVCLSLFGFWLIEKYVYRSAQEKVIKDLEIVRTFYNLNFEEMRLGFNMMDEHDDLGLMRTYLGLDYLYWISAEKEKEKDHISPLAARAFLTAQDIGATRIIPRADIEQVLGVIEPISIVPTPKAMPTDQSSLVDVLSMEYVKPFVDNNGTVEKVLVGGKLLNRNFTFIDKMVNTVYENRLFHSKPVGTITIFQHDVRIATNVLDAQGKRAIGTRVSDVVYKRVIQEKKRWYSRAFVVTDWYFTAYEPIFDLDNRVIGILYVGLLEAPFIEVKKQYYMVLTMMLVVAVLTAVMLSAVVSRSIAGHLTGILITTQQIAAGNPAGGPAPETGIEEVNALSRSIRNMAGTIAAREENLDSSNRKLEILNKSYLDLISFVSHELKGILSSIILNTYLLKKGILGQINEQQSKTLNSMGRNLDYLANTVKNFLNLSRIEKNELEISKSEIRLKGDIFDVSAEAFEQQLQERSLSLSNTIDEQIVVSADPSLLQIVANNLLSNAIKYGREGGSIRISSRTADDTVEVEVYNDGQPLHESDVDKLFRKFSRVLYRGMEKIKGSGIGLYITKEIIKLHGGTIKAVPRENGNSFVFQIEKE